MNWLILILLLLAIVLVIRKYLQRPEFGAVPAGKRLKRIQSSKNYKNGKFENLTKTPQLSQSASYISVIWRYFFYPKKNLIPNERFHFNPADLKNLDPDKDIMVWMGHSSYFIQLGGRKMLIDPVFSGHASPFNWSTKAFAGADIYTPDDIPDLDYLIITHDHWDHLDYTTVSALQMRVDTVITGLGTGAHLEHWGYAAGQIKELDWWESTLPEAGIKVTAVPTRHFSGRSLARNKALWTGFVWEAAGLKLLLGGDGGYGEHFGEIGRLLGPFDLAILEAGQYNKDWPYIHMMPGEHARAMADLQAHTAMMVHNSKFSLSVHPWNEPMESVVKGVGSDKRILTPRIGELVKLRDKNQHFDYWWRELA